MAKYAISPEGIRALKKLSSDILIVCNNLMDCSTKLQSSLVDLENDLGIYHVLINDIAMSNKSLLLKNKEDFEDLAARVCNQADELNSLLNFGDVGFVENTNNASQNSEGRVSVTVPITGKAQYESINDIPEKYYSLIRKYNADSGSFNDVIRAGKTTKDVKQMKKMIDKHSLFEDKQLYRNASVADFSSLGIYRHYNNSENKEFDIIDIDSFLSSPKARDKEYLWKVGTRLFNDSNSEKREKGLRIIENLSDREFVDAQLILADFYEKHHEEAKAFVWYERAAKNGNDEAAFKMYMMCGAAGDYINAAKWCEQAAQRGNVDAQFHYGVLLQQGIGLSANKQLALQWYKRSAMAGHIEAKKRHDELLAIINL
ncbi:MAG: tetratricopeptide repeat protein [Eubacteriales bacterium]|nr:tetratricopeptide repeat protein [Eubacteriales bacterium]